MCMTLQVVEIIGNLYILSLALLNYPTQTLVNIIFLLFTYYNTEYYLRKLTLAEKLLVIHMEKEREAYHIFYKFQTFVFTLNF